MELEQQYQLLKCWDKICKIVNEKTKKLPIIPIQFGKIEFSNNSVELLIGNGTYHCFDMALWTPSKVMSAVLYFIIEELVYTINKTNTVFSKTSKFMEDLVKYEDQNNVFTYKTFSYVIDLMIEDYEEIVLNDSEVKS